MTKYTRSDWDARSPDPRGTVPKKSRTGGALHHTTGSNLGRDDCAEWVRAIQNFHMDTRDWSDIGYQELVCRHGDRFEGRPWGVQGAHASGHNVTHVGICAMGDMRRVDNITDALLRGLVESYDDACDWAGRSLDPIGHGQLAGASTACPGPILQDWWTTGMVLAPDDAQPTPGSGAGSSRLILPAKPIIRAVRKRPVAGSRTERETRRVQAELTWVHGLGGAVGPIDGWPGPRTASAVKLLQKREGARLVDGIPGPETWPMILT